MPTWPTNPVCKNVVPLAPRRDILEFNSFDGYKHRRPRSTRRLRRYQLVYGAMPWHDFLTFQDFMSIELDGGSLTCDWTAPETLGITISSIDTGTPRVVTCAYNHGLSDREQVVLANTGIDATYVVTRISPTQISLTGSSGGSTITTGVMLPHLSAAFIDLSDSAFVPSGQKILGPSANDQGLFGLVATLQEALS